MKRMSRVAGALAACVTVLAVSASPASAEPGDADFRTTVAKSMVQLKVSMTGQVRMEFGADQIWSPDVVLNFACAGFAVDRSGEIVTAANCVDAASKGAEDRLREKALDWAAATAGFDAARTEYLKGTAKAANWKVAANRDSPDKAAAVDVQVRRVDTPDVTGFDWTPATTVTTQPRANYGRAALVKISGDVDLEPLPVIDGPVGIGTAAYAFATSHFDAAKPRPTVTMTRTQITANPTAASGGSPSQFSGEYTGTVIGAPLVGEDGVALGVIVGDSPPIANNSADFRQFLESHDVEFVADEEPATSNRWLWLGPTIGGAVLLLIIVVVLALRIRRKRAGRRSAQPGAGVPGPGMPGAAPYGGPFHGDQHSGGQYSGGQYSAGQYGGGQYSGGQYSGGQHSAGQYGSYSGDRPQTPPPPGPQAPGQYDPTQLGQPLPPVGGPGPNYYDPNRRNPNRQPPNGPQPPHRGA